MKKLKIAQVVGILILLLGVIIRAGTGEYWGTGVAALGAIVYAAARVISWIQNDNAA